MLSWSGRDVVGVAVNRTWLPDSNHPNFYGVQCWPSTGYFCKVALEVLPLML